MARAEGQPLHGELRMGVIPTIAPFLLPAMLPRLRHEWPSLKLYLREETSQAACEALHRGQLDCVLLALPYACGEIDSRALFDDPLFVAFPRGEAPRGQDVDVSAIDENRMLLLEDGHCLKDHALAACSRPDLRAHAAMMGTSLHTLVQMVDNGLGVTFIPSMAIDAGILEGTQVDAKPLRSNHGYRQIALIWRRSSPREFRVPAPRRDAAPDHARHQSRARDDRSRFPGARGRTRLIFTSDTPRRRGGEGWRRGGRRVRLTWPLQVPERWPMTAPPGETGRNGRYSSPWSTPRRSPARTSLRCLSRHRPRLLPAADCWSRK